MGCFSSTERNTEVYYGIEPLPRDSDWNKWVMWKGKFFNTVNNGKLEMIKSPEGLGALLKKVIGPYGLDIIAENFIFHDSCDEQNFDILLAKLDTLFYLRLFPRVTERESIREYVDRIKQIAVNYGRSKPDTAVKEKIIYDLNQSNFLEIITEIIYIRNSFRLKHLNMNEIIFLVNAYENQQFRGKREDFLQQMEINKTFLFPRYNHNCCGSYHLSHETCPASGKRCYKCNGLNHFASTCCKLYVIDCIQCGINHAENQCPAFGMQCSRCDGLYHFHWKCLSRIMTFCENCGSSHVDVRRKCLAFGKICSKCGKPGHLSKMCENSRRS